MRLDTIAIAFQSGATAEEIAQQFPSVTLRDVYLIIGHYLTHTTEIDAYVFRREVEALALQREIETRSDPLDIRAGLLARRDAGRANKS